MLKNNIYNIDTEFDYPTIKDIMIESLKIAKEEAFKKRANIPHDTISEDNNYTTMSTL